MNKSFWLIMGAVIIGLGAIFALSGGKADEVNTGEFAYAEPLTGVQSFDHQQGEGTKATIIEYGDFQCPSCGALFPILEQVKQQFGDEVKVVYRNYPISSIHPQAMAAHRAAEAAAKQGMFWEMHDQLFITQQQWSGNDSAASIFEGFAEDLGLDMDQYRADVGSDSVFSKINSDLESGEQIGVNSTPTIIINGEVQQNVPRSLEEFSAIINGGSPDQSQEQR